ncbi:melanocyte-stimulating hormone receptor-like [Penaeus chinensis]|uniref:melanocyte-stimulating hormone receptor-like n=1 Tax=Penaeus chinensis TaxID=139456 RepID=UPI001FB7C775|nr:melanocyte-stimulating hormone receptor-like [Penaeus chinensis]
MTEELRAEVNTSLSSADRAVGGLGFVGLQFGLTLLVCASSGLIVVTILRNVSLSSQYFFWYLLNFVASIFVFRLAYLALTIGLLRKFAGTGISLVSSPDVCLFYLMIGSFYRAVMHMSVLLIALERYITILKPLTHCYILTDKRIKYSIASTWFIATCYTVGMVVHRYVYDAPGVIAGCNIEIYGIWKIYVSQMTVSILVFISVLAMYMHLHVIGRKHLRIIEAERRIFSLVRYQRSLRRSKVAFMITLQIFCLEVPVYILTMMYLMKAGQLYAKYAFLLISLGQISQPAFYALFSSEFRKALKKLMKQSAVQPLGDHLHVGSGRFRRDLRGEDAPGRF